MSAGGSRFGRANQRSMPSAASSVIPNSACARALIAAAMRAASATVGTMSSGTGTQLLAPDIGTPEDAHAGALVQPRRAGRVLTVDAEGCGRLATRREPTEALVQQ